MDPHQHHPDVVDPAMAPRQRIIHAALGLIIEHGLGGVTMTALAKAAGVSRQTLYNNFPDVGSVVVEAVSQHNTEALKQLDASLELCPTPGDKVVHLVRHFVALGTHGDGQQIELGLSAAAQSQLAAYEESVNERIQSTLLEGVQSGEFRPDLDPATDTTLIHALLKGAQTAASRQPQSATVIAQTAVRTVLAALSAESPVHAP